MDERDVRLSVRDIGLIVPSNVGDAVLTLPIIAELAQQFPKAHITIAGGARARAVFAGDPRIGTFLDYGNDQHTWRDRLHVVRQLRRRQFDLFLDVRHTMIPWCVRARARTNPLRPPPRDLMHRHDRYRWHLDVLLHQVGVQGHQPLTVDALWALTDAEQRHAAIWTQPWALHARSIVAVSPGARSDPKRWPATPFARLCDALMHDGLAHVVLTGEASEQHIIRDVEARMTHTPQTLASLTTVRTLAALLTSCDVVVTNDSATLHVASSVGTPVVALFGPTDPAKYGPRSPHSVVVQRLPMDQIAVEDVRHAVQGIVHAHKTHHAAAS